MSENELSFIIIVRPAAEGSFSGPRKSGQRAYTEARRAAVLGTEGPQEAMRGANSSNPHPISRPFPPVVVSSTASKKQGQVHLPENSHYVWTIFKG